MGNETSATNQTLPPAGSHQTPHILEAAGIEQQDVSAHQQGPPFDPAFATHLEIRSDSTVSQAGITRAAKRYRERVD